MLRADMDRGAQHVPNEKRASSGGVSRDVGRSTAPTKACVPTTAPQA